MKKRIQKQAAEGKSRSRHQSAHQPKPAAPAAAIPQHVKEQTVKQSFSGACRAEERLRETQPWRAPQKFAINERSLRDAHALEFVADTVHCHVFEGALNLDIDRREWDYEALSQFACLLDRQPHYLREVVTALRQYVQGVAALLDFVTKYQPDVAKHLREEAAARAAFQAKAKPA